MAKSDFSMIPTKTNMYAPKGRDYDTSVKPSQVPGKGLTRQPAKTAVGVFLILGVCTTSREGRRVIRMAEESLKERLEDMYHSPKGQEVYRLRKQKVELPFGHMKRNLGAGQFLLRGKKGVDAELSILSTCFNVARMTTIIGIPALILKLQGM
ncbi:MAG TPA: transposase [Nitrospinota bacterium]|nr:transposase [Nitrospinota bacterium]